jgi:acetyltransferase-like isoleucine patch superfamily enzyme
MIKLLKSFIQFIFFIKNKSKLNLEIGKNSKILNYKIHPVSGNRIEIGENCILNCRISFDRENAKFIVGDRCYIGASSLVIAEEIECGNDVVISWGVTIVDHNSHAIEWSGRKNDILDWHKGIKDWSNVKIAKVKIGDRCWIGFNAIILKGVTLGAESIVAAGSVVTKDVPEGCIVGGNPAMVIGKTKISPKVDG